MIKSISTNKSSILHQFWGNTIEFNEGINVVCGANESGKSILLNSLAEYTFIKKGKGWSSPTSFGDLPFMTRFYDFDIIKHIGEKSEFGV